MYKEERWIEDEYEKDNGNENECVEDEDYFGSRLFDNDAAPHDEVEITFGDTALKLSGNIKTRYPHLLQSTGLTLWGGSKNLCEYLCDHPEYVKGKVVVELGAGLGSCGIVAQKKGASKVILTDGDTDTLANMRLNVAANLENNDGETIVCKQLIWGKNIDKFRELHLPGGKKGFDVVMGGDIIYAQESLEPLFQTVTELLTKESGGVFLQSYMFRNGVTMDEAFEVAKRHGFQWQAPENGVVEGVYVFYLESS